jgi:hypothetical protein
VHCGAWVSVEDENGAGAAGARACTDDLRDTADAFDGFDERLRGLGHDPESDLGTVVVGDDGTEGLTGEEALGTQANCREGILECSSATAHPRDEFRGGLLRLACVDEDGVLEDGSWIDVEECGSAATSEGERSSVPDHREIEATVAGIHLILDLACSFFTFLAEQAARGRDDERRRRPHAAAEREMRCDLQRPAQGMGRTGFAAVCDSLSVLYPRRVDGRVVPENRETLLSSALVERHLEIDRRRNGDAAVAEDDRVLAAEDDLARSRRCADHRRVVS